jgi:hypothetical protein
MVFRFLRRLRAKTPKAYLIETRQFIADHPWGQGSLFNERTGAYCVLGALDAVFVDDMDRISVQTRSDALRLLKSQGLMSLVAYNDSPGRTKEDVLAWFDTAIARA